MKRHHQLALSVLTGVSIGVAGARAIHAQQTKTPPGYFIAELEIADRTGIQKYGEKVPETLAPFKDHYRFLIRGGKPQGLEDEAPRGLVVIAFDSAQQARDWYDSPAYQAIKPIRQRAAKSRIFIAEGIAPQ